MVEKKFKIHIINENNLLESIFLSARNCYNNNSFIELKEEYTKEKALKLTKSLLKREHMSIFEHCIIQFYLEDVSRSFLTQLSRHRIGMSLTVKSQHYINHRNFNYKTLETENTEAKILYNKTMNMLNKSYIILTDKLKIPHFIAREILPNSATCNIFITINIRELIHIFNIRLGRENTPEIRIIFKQLLNKLFYFNQDLWLLIIEHYNFKEKIK
jgi:thymidylate synthase (FAD)